LEKIRLRQLKNGVEINGKVFKEGENVKIKDVDAMGRIREEMILKGTVRFGIYDDIENWLDTYHLGWYIEVNSEKRYTLIDAVLFNLILF